MTDEKHARQMTLAATFGQRLKFAREAQGWSQSELARQTNLTQPKISRMEAGRGAPGPLILIKLAASLSISTDYLLGLSDKPRWLNYRDQDLMHRSIDLVAPKDRPLVQGILRLFLQKNL